MTTFLTFGYAQVQGAKGPIFEDGPNFDMAFKLFHGKNGVVPLTENPHFPVAEPIAEPTPQFNPLAAKAATISLSAFGPGGPFSFGPFSDKWRKQKKRVDSSDKKGPSSEVVYLSSLSFYFKYQKFNLMICSTYW